MWLYQSSSSISNRSVSLQSRMYIYFLLFPALHLYFQSMVLLFNRSTYQIEKCVIRFIPKQRCDYICVFQLCWSSEVILYSEELFNYIVELTKFWEIVLRLINWNCKMSTWMLFTVRIWRLCLQFSYCLMYIMLWQIQIKGRFSTCRGNHSASYGSVPDNMHVDEYAKIKYFDRTIKETPEIPANQKMSKKIGNEYCPDDP